MCPHQAHPLAQRRESFLPPGLPNNRRQEWRQIHLQYSSIDVDHVFDDKSSTDYIYEIAAKPIIHQALRGFNGNSDIIAGCIMAYGQTSSGKTHTMKGTLEYPGIVPLALSDIFDTIKA